MQNIDDILELLLIILGVIIVFLLYRRIFLFVGDAYWSIKAEMSRYLKFTFMCLNNTKLCSEYTYTLIHTS